MACLATAYVLPSGGFEFLRGGSRASFEIAGIRNSPPLPVEASPSTDSIAEVQNVPSVAPTTAKALAAAGLGSLESLRSAPDSEPLGIPGVGPGLVRKIPQHLGGSQHSEHALTAHHVSTLHRMTR